MKFEWDTAKNKVNIKKHGIDFIDVEALFEAPMLTQLDSRQDYGEDRWIGIGTMVDLTVVVVFVERHEETIRIISARKATVYEEKKYQEAIRHGLETS